ncbi:1-deoxy-D-xylulose-5-phosphate synthase N-terminal domain-containing protein, partial [Streptomyces noursei]
LRTTYLLPARVHGVRQDIANRVHDRQLRLHGMGPEQLDALLRGLTGRPDATATTADGFEEGARATAHA